MKRLGLIITAAILAICTSVVVLYKNRVPVNPEKDFLKRNIEALMSGEGVTMPCLKNTFYICYFVVYDAAGNASMADVKGYRNSY